MDIIFRDVLDETLSLVTIRMHVDLFRSVALIQRRGHMFSWLLDDGRHTHGLEGTIAE